jgi:hypothetical protein
LFIYGCSSSNAKEANNAKVTNTSETKDISYPYFEYNSPLTEQYYQQFMDSEMEFCQMSFYYVVYLEPPEAYNYGLNFFALTEYVNSECVNQTLEDIEVFSATHDIDDDSSLSYFEYKIPIEHIMPIFNLIQQNPGYYFNAEEYGEEESLSFVAGGELGNKNFVTLKIGLPGRTELSNHQFKAFSKGWDLGDDPPEELLPLIDYIENTILPIMREHPFEV